MNKSKEQDFPAPFLPQKILPPQLTTNWQLSATMLVVGRFVSVLTDREASHEKNKEEDRFYGTMYV